MPGDANDEVVVGTVAQQDLKGLAAVLAPLATFFGASERELGSLKYGLGVVLQTSPLEFDRVSEAVAAPVNGYRFGKSWFTIREYYPGRGCKQVTITPVSVHRLVAEARHVSLVELRTPQNERSDISVLLVDNVGYWDVGTVAGVIGTTVEAVTAVLSANKFEADIVSEPTVGLFSAKISGDLTFQFRRGKEVIVVKVPQPRSEYEWRAEFIRTVGKVLLNLK